MCFNCIQQKLVMLLYMLLYWSHYPLPGNSGLSLHTALWLSGGQSVWKHCLRSGVVSELQAQLILPVCAGEPIWQSPEPLSDSSGWAARSRLGCKTSAGRHIHWRLGVLVNHAQQRNKALQWLPLHSNTTVPSSLVRLLGDKTLKGCEILQGQ